MNQCSLLDSILLISNYLFPGLNVQERVRAGDTLGPNDSHYLKVHLSPSTQC